MANSGRWLRAPFTPRLVVWGVLAAVGVVLHGGTALLRLSTFWPYPRLVDFSGFYAAVWAWRAGYTPYTMPDTWLTQLMMAQRIPFRPPPIYNPPPLILLVLPLTLVPFPVAAWLWTLLNTGLALLAARWLAELAGLRGRRAWGVAALLTLTYGPLVLDMSLGQVSVLLLTCALLWLRGKDEQRLRPSALALALATGLKLFPVTWLGAALFSPWQARKTALRYSLATLMALALLSVVLMPTPTYDYAKHVLFGRVSSAAATPGVDDQSLLAWATRLTQPQHFVIHDVEASAQRVVSWTPRNAVPYPAVAGMVTALLTLLGVSALAAMLQAREETQRLGAWSAWLVLGLIALPHMERYNHVLLLPALAWLWGTRPQRRGWVIGAYTMEGLARLTHAFAGALPFPAAAWMSGWGLYAALLTFAVVIVESRKLPTWRSERIANMQDLKSSTKPTSSVTNSSFKTHNVTGLVQTPLLRQSALQTRPIKRLTTSASASAKSKMDAESQKHLKSIIAPAWSGKRPLPADPNMQSHAIGDEQALAGNQSFKRTATSPRETDDTQDLAGFKTRLSYNSLPGLAPPDLLQNLFRIPAWSLLNDAPLWDNYALGAYPLADLPLHDAQEQPNLAMYEQFVTLPLNDAPTPAEAEADTFKLDQGPLND